MKTKTASLKVTLMAALVTVGLVGGVGAFASVARASVSPSSTSPGARLNLHSKSATPTTTMPPASSDGGGLIIDGPSRSECLAPNVVGSGLGALQTAITKFDNLTDTSVSCISTYLNGATNWSTWEHPWVAKSQFGYTAWVAADPQSRQLVLQVDLIPNNLKNVQNPLSWELSCAAGDFNSRATVLGTSLVAAGLEHSVIRLGAEMNGTWEADYVGSTSIEQQLWVRCFRNEVTGLRRAVGQHFLIDWNPNPCTSDPDYSRFYPGNAYVNIIGLDLFDVSCSAPATKYSFTRLSDEPGGLAGIQTFASAHRKPMSLPEWGLVRTPAGDDPAFVDGIGASVDGKDYAFETYFDGSGVRIKVLPLGSRTPLSLTAFQRWFGGGTKRAVANS